MLIVAVTTLGIAAMANNRPVMPGMLFIVAFVLFMILFTVLMVLWGIQRSHDMDWSGWMLLLTFIPFAAFIWWFKKGTPGPNRFGPPPPPNSLSVKIISGIAIFLIVLFFVIGIVAAPAIPAYQGYLQRAHAGQEQE
jgi:uncharacterized membrane protein YhaH (DUF805 family)